MLCEIPFTLKKDEALELFRLAEEKNLVLLEASKTAYCPAFGHIVTLIKSGIIGEVVDVKAALSKMVAPPTRELDSNQACSADIDGHNQVTWVRLERCRFPYQA